MSVLRAQSSRILKREKELKQGEEREAEEGPEGDFIIYGLKLIEVHKRTTLLKPGSMDSHKKVAFPFLIFPSLFLDIWVFSFSTLA